MPTVVSWLAFGPVTEALREGISSIHLNLQVIWLPIEIELFNVSFSSYPSDVSLSISLCGFHLLYLTGGFVGALVYSAKTFEYDLCNIFFAYHNSSDTYGITSTCKGNIMGDSFPSFLPSFPLRTHSGFSFYL